MLPCLVRGRRLFAASVCLPTSRALRAATARLHSPILPARAFPLLLAPVLAAGCAEDDCVPTPGPTQDLPELDAWLEEQRVANGLIGLAAVVSGPDGLAWSGGAGWEDMDHAIRIPE